MKHQPVSIFSTRRFSKLMEDYVNEEKELQPLYSRPHKRESYHTQLEARKAFPVQRDVLVDSLLSQHSKYDLEDNYPLVHEHIMDLKSEQTYTVVTGHQVCLFSGPLFFIYKIVNTIRLAEELSDELKVKVVPVFWMATEDHDFEEVNHIWYNQIKYQWERPAGNAVGRMHTDGVEEVIDQLASAVGDSRSVSDWLDLLRRCYRTGQTLADATRELALELFGNKGLIVLDADDANLKRCVAPIFKKELEEQVCTKVMANAASTLDESYFTQVNPRDINLFYLEDEMRYRLTWEGDQIVTVDGSHRFTLAEILNELETSPEKFSPNVVLRPVYQEVILPNLAYIGGGGELAYWLQLKPVFDTCNIPFPILRLRNSAGFIRRKFFHKMEKLNLSFNDIVDPLFEQERAHFRSELGLESKMDKLKTQAAELFDSMNGLASEIDSTLQGTAKAYNARQQHLLENFEKKILNAAKRRDGEVTRMLAEIHSEAFPSGGLQERRDNYITLLERFGPNVLEILFDELDPFEHTFSWFIE